MTIDQYIQNINAAYRRGNATEHTYRGDLKQLIESIVPHISATNEPKRQKCGAPDYILMKKDIPVGFIEAKDVGDKDMEGAKKTCNKEQFDRYKASLDNLIFTDYLSFYIYHDAELITKVSLAEIVGNEIVALPQNFTTFTNLIKDFCSHVGQNIKSSKKLAEMMAAKARLLSDVIEKALTRDENKQEDSTLKDQMLAFKDILIHDITPKGFADVYAQTIAYGMFAARLHDTTIDSFNRQEAAELIPKSNPFLRKLFSYIAGPDIDDRIRWIVDNLAEVFLACNVEQLLKDYGKATKMEDPIIHFYETFLSEYDPALRKARGVWYTPQPVVSFIVRAVDDILKTEFGLSQGLADTSKTKIMIPDFTKATSDRRSKTRIEDREVEVHRVQILDPATGTGTFLAETIKHIHKRFEGQEGIWSKYVETHLLPRLNGFELLMASYAMAHLKLDLLLTETGYVPTSDQRFRIYLTNSLEEHHPDTGTLFASWLSSEANEANRIKRDAPVMVVMGNPPYSGISSNNGKWISDLIEDYKYIDGEHFNERKHWLNDDYVKFIRYGQHFIEKNGSGVLAFINPHGFLDNPTFRGMRWHLLKTFDKIYTIDLHGNSKKKETALDGSKDENVFDIMQGVSINFFVKTGKKNTNELGEIFHYDLFGKRDLKYNFLIENSLKSIDYNKLNPEKPYLFFVPKNNIGTEDYETGFSIEKLFSINVTGIVTARDSLVINENREVLLDKINLFTNSEYSDTEIRKIFFGSKKDGKYLAGDSRGWSLIAARQKIKDNNHLNIIKTISYRPFDNRYIYYSPDMVDWGREKLMQHIIKGKNIGLVVARQTTDDYWCNVQLTTNIIDNRYHFSYKGIPSEFPLYLYPEASAQQTIDQQTERRPNLNMEMVAKVAEGLGLKFTSEKEENEGTFAPIDILDYIYAVLHSPTYREKYKEFLKIDFPRVPYPKIEVFWQLVKLGGELRQIHLLESEIVEKPITRYPVNGDNVVSKPKFENGNVFINDTQFFANVPEVAWNFYIGGYQPAQKWLKDRKERELEYEDIEHYQKIIVALTETDRIMKEIDGIEIV